MKVGDIIRRKCSTDNKPIGPYMRIVHIKDNLVYADTIGRDEPNILISKKNCHICKHKTLIVSEEVLERLKSGKQIAVSHPMCTTWYNVYLKTPDLIIFRTALKNYKAMFVIENVRSLMSLGKPTIRIVVNYKIE